MLNLYVNEKNQATFVCPSCGFEKRFDARPFKKKGRLNIKCKCGKPWELNIEFRKYIRKATSLTGLCTVKRTKESCNVVVKDLSLFGIGIEFLMGSKKLLKTLEPGMKLQVSFNLDDKNETAIDKSCVIRIIRGMNVGAEFDDEKYTKELGFYLMNG